MRSDDGYFSAPARGHLDEEDGAFVRLRFESPEVGFRHTVIDERGAIIATSSGKTDSDAWTRVPTRWSARATRSTEGAKSRPWSPRRR